MKKRLLLAAILVFSIILASCAQEKVTETETPQQEQILQKEIQINTMTFEVTIPENTIEGDTVWVYIRQLPHKMEKIEDYIYSVTLNEVQLFGEGYIVGVNEKLKYRYSRNGYDFHTAEYLKPTPEEPDRDTNNYFWTAHGREIDYEPGKIQKDTIERWRWFPKEGMITKTTDLEPSGKFLPRVNNMEFRSGQTIEDLYVPAFHDFFNSTAEHLKEQGYTWIELDPPWQWIEEGGLPKVKNLADVPEAGAPNYPDDETLLEELNAYKQQDLKVLVAPQLCCTPLDTKDKPIEWWNAYFDETEKFLVHFAKLAQQGKADAFMYAIPSSQMESAPVDVAAKWKEIWKSVHKEFQGEVGQMVWIGGPPTPQPIPSPESITWYDQLDFILIATEYPLSEKDNPTDEELFEGAAKILDSMKPFYDKFKKPLLVRNGYFNVKYSWKGQTFYQINSIPWIGDSEAALKESKYEFDTVDHTRTLNAYFRAIAERPWIIGYFHFGYTHWEDPLSLWMSIRGKPAEDLWRKWNEAIYNE